MNKLLINTANDDLFIVLKKGNALFFKRNHSKMHHNETMLPLIDEILKEQDIDVNNINEFGVVIGPGSFTGIRVGVSTIKAFKDSVKVNAKGINNLDYLFKLAKSKNKDVKVVAILGSKDSYFVARDVNGIVYKYEHNLTLEQLKLVAGDSPVGMFKKDENLNCLVVEDNAEIFVECLNKSNDYSLVPVYYQLSQAENEKLKRSEVEIKLATVQDLEEIKEIEQNSIHSNHLTDEDLKKAIGDENYQTYVAKIDNVIAGYIILQISDEINILSVAVKKEYRNLGLATKLIEQSENFAKEKEVINLSLEVAKDNISAYLLYEKLGFKQRRIRKNYYEDGADCIEMVKHV